MKGIILAGGTGTRLYPITLSVSKQLLPVYDKPLIYYPLTTLINAGVSDILIITTPRDQPQFQQLLGDGSRIGCRFSYAAQDQPRGLAHALIVAEDFIGDEKVCLILGDNIFYGTDLDKKVRRAARASGCVIFGAPVHDPERYGVVTFNKDMKVTSIIEKPAKPRSNYAIPGLYFFDNKCVGYARAAKPSARGEYEITEVINAYLKAGRLKVQLLDRGTAWLDTGTFASLNQASQFVQVIEERQGLKIGCVEEAAFRQGLISKRQLAKLASGLSKSGYGYYLTKIIKEA